MFENLRLDLIVMLKSRPGLKAGPGLGRGLAGRPQYN
jgi:hypothetical protein